VDHLKKFGERNFVKIPSYREGYLREGRVARDESSKPESMLLEECTVKQVPCQSRTAMKLPVEGGGGR